MGDKKCDISGSAVSLNFKLSIMTLTVLYKSTLDHWTPTLPMMTLSC